MGSVLSICTHTRAALSLTAYRDKNTHAGAGVPFPIARQKQVEHDLCTLHTHATLCWQCAPRSLLGSFPCLLSCCWSCRRRRRTRGDDEIRPSGIHNILMLILPPAVHIHLLSITKYRLLIWHEVLSEFDFGVLHAQPSELNGGIPKLCDGRTRVVALESINECLLFFCVQW